MRTCICIKEIKSNSGRTFEVNCKYSFISKVSKPFDILVFYPPEWKAGSSTGLLFFGDVFNKHFIDLQQHRQNLINQII